MNKNLSIWAAVLQELFSSWENTARVTVCIVWAVCVVWVACAVCVHSSNKFDEGSIGGSEFKSASILVLECKLIEVIGAG